MKLVVWKNNLAGQLLYKSPDHPKNGVNVKSNYREYARFGSVISEKPATYREKMFPKITFCPNSMHSRDKLLTHYSYMNYTILNAIYGGCKHQCDKPVKTAYSLAPKVENFSSTKTLDFFCHQNYRKNTVFRRTRASE